MVTGFNAVRIEEARFFEQNLKLLILDIFNQPLVFSEDTQPLGAMVVIEFKKPDRSKYRDEDPISQVYRMVREIRQGRVKDKAGRYIQPANDRIPAYCYIWVWLLWNDG